ncbi:LysR family transcriptional regulator [Colwellia sp. E2M01]|uniref:LysR family transcriptional regulator n=1 Tax=Colwellia sp. E2M01 TaxID=2841561 RepID=UPI001C08A88B|nr:LysR family transcriptional regulator [Colwellia sp. E2M01]MBU2871432.1 LysR family transcriptional regulator [Colwellia sp. E2M01]
MKVNYSLDDLRCFCAVARLASFKEAAINLNMPLSTLSRRISKLEDDLQLRLLNRDAHRVSLTSTGEQYYLRSNTLFDELADIDNDLHKDKHEPKGKVVVTAPIYSGKQFLRPIFYDFLLKYPEIQLDLRFSNDLIDIEGQAIDVAFRMGNPSIEEWVVRPLKHAHNILCCHPDYVIGDITHPEQLTENSKITCASLLPWRLVNQQTKEEVDYHPKKVIRLEVDEIQMVTHAVKMGLGVSYLPDYLVLPLIESGDIKQVLPQWQSKERKLSMLYRDRNNMPLRVRLFIEYVLQHFRE